MIKYKNVFICPNNEELTLDETNHLCNKVLNERDINSKTSVRIYYSINPSLALDRYKKKRREQNIKIRVLYSTYRRNFNF